MKHKTTIAALLITVLLSCQKEIPQQEIKQTELPNGVMMETVVNTGTFQMIFKKDRKVMRIITLNTEGMTYGECMQSMRERCWQDYTCSYYYHNFMGAVMEASWAAYCVAASDGKPNRR